MGSLLARLKFFLYVAYVVWPLDFVPDFLPVLGWVDDLVAAYLAYQQYQEFSVLEAE